MSERALRLGTRGSALATTQAGQVAGKDGQTRAHGFQNRDGQALVFRQQHKHLVLCQAVGHIVALARKDYVVQVQLLRQGLVGGQVRAIPYDGGGWFQAMLRAQQCQGV